MVKAKGKMYPHMWRCGSCGGTPISGVKKSDTGKKVELTCEYCGTKAMIFVGKNNGK